MKLIVIGASAGSLEPISEVLGGLPADLDDAVILVRHLAPGSDNLLAELLAGCTARPSLPRINAGKTAC